MTTPTTRTERIEEYKSLIDAEIEVLRNLREDEQDAERWLVLDEQIDALLVKQDNAAAEIDNALADMVEHDLKQKTAAWMDEAEAEHSEWLDEHNTIESVRP